MPLECSPARPLRYVIVGPPNSGKSYYVLEHAQLDDLVWDFDAVVPSIAAHRQRVRHEPLPRHIVDAARAMREGLLEYIAAAPLPNRAVYIIATNPEQAERIAARIGGVIISLY